jgi:hypothetical protein
MPSKMMRLLAAATALAATAALAAPSSALAKHKKPSAVDVYVEQVQTASGHQAAPSTSGGASSGVTVPLTSQAKSKLKSKGGKDAPLLKQIITHPGFERKLAAVGDTAQPGTFNAAFDLGTGPTVLFALVLGTVLFVAVSGGLRGWRRRRLR